MKMKPHRVGARYSKDSISLARRFHDLAARGENALRARLRESANCHNRPGAPERRLGVDAFEAKIYPGRMQSRGGAGVHVRNLS